MVGGEKRELRRLATQCGAQYGDISYYHDNTIKYKALYITIIQYGPFLYWEYKGGKSHIANIGILDRGQFAQVGNALKNYKESSLLTIAKIIK
jgi:hypothetical protein